MTTARDFARGVNPDHPEAFAKTLKKRDPDVVQQENGNIVPAGRWLACGRVSVRHASTRYMEIRNDETGRAVKVSKSSPAARDALQMAMYAGQEPTAYAQFCFGKELPEELSADAKQAQRVNLEKADAKTDSFGFKLEHSRRAIIVDGKPAGYLCRPHGWGRRIGFERIDGKRVPFHMAVPYLFKYPDDHATTWRTIADLRDIAKAHDLGLLPFEDQLTEIERREKEAEAQREREREERRAARGREVEELRRKRMHAATLLRLLIEPSALASEFNLALAFAADELDNLAKE